MTKYNLKIEIDEVGKNSERDYSIWDYKNISPKEVMSILAVIHRKWVNVIDNLKTKK